MTDARTPLIFVVPGPMRGKQRPRATTIAGRARMFTPSSTVNAEAHVKQCCIQQIGQPVLDGAVTLDVTLDVAIPASWPKKRRAAALAGEIRPTSKPDIDNCLKLIADALNGIAWRDDSQIVGVRVRKIYADAARTIITIASQDS